MDMDDLMVVNEPLMLPMDLDTSIIDKVPFEPIHIEDLARMCDLDVNQLIEKITVLALNEDIIMMPGQMVCRNE